MKNNISKLKIFYSAIFVVFALFAFCPKVFAVTFSPTTAGPTGAIQTYTIPSTGSYTIEAWGAQGGGGITNNVAGGLGAYAKGTVSLTAGDVLQILVGQQGGTGSSSYDPQGNENGGGGGTFVVKQTGSVPLVVAGGGGGGYSTTYGTSCTRTASDGSGQSTTTGMTINCNGTGSGGSGGAGGSTFGSYQGGAGGGFSTNGANGGTHCSVAMGGQSFTSGGTGGAGNSCYSSANFGGFGGGGGGQLGGPGAGGGYSGGGSAGSWSSYSTYGGGGGSYVVAGATGTVLTAGSRSGAGEVIITAGGGGGGGGTSLFRAASYGSTNSGTSLTLNVPAGTVNADVMLAIITVSGGSGSTITTPAGWTLVRRDDNSTSLSTLVYSKVASSEPASYAWSFNGASLFSAGGIVSYSGIDTTNPIDVSGVPTISGVSSTAVIAASANTTSANVIVVAYGAGTNGAYTSTPPTGMTERVDTNNGGSRNLTIADVSQAAAGATGTKTFTYSGSITYNAGIIGLKTCSATFCAAANGSGATGSIQTFTAPSTGKYRILAKGASGGKNTSFAVTGGAGASIQGDFYLTAGEVLNIMVGQAGGDGQGGAGGGGTFVVKNPGNSNISLVVAGGGGGAHQQNGDPGLATNNGTPNGGTGYSYGTGGGGFSTNGTVGGSGPGAGITAALSYLSGGTGGSSNTGGTAIGGYGGGGGAHSGCGGACGAGGGGGYNGGNVQLYYGNGGGSYNAGISQTNTQGGNTGNGSAIITYIGGSAGPLVISPTKAGITSNGATLGGNITSDGGSGVTTRGVCVSTAANPVLGGTCFTAGVPSGTGVFTASATSLNVNTTYYYRAYATNANGTTYSPNDTFTTLNLSLPTITTPTKVTTSSSDATLGGNVTSDGGAAITRRGVCYSTTDATPGYSALDTPEAGVTCQTTTGTTGVFTVNVTGLSVATYNYRAFAYNSQGYQYTTNDTFIILAAPTGLNPSTTTSNGLRTITWNAVPNAAFYYIRIDDKADGWLPPVCDNGTTPTTGDVCQKPTTNSYSYNFQAGHTYSYWVHAGNSVGYGTATTIDPVTVIAPPVIMIVSDSTTTTQAVLTAKINPNNYLSSAFFKWSTSVSDTCAAMANTVSVLNNQVGTADITFSTTLTGLDYGTNYYYCAGGTNTYGTSYSDGASYSSTGAPKMITTTTPQPTVVTKTASYISSVARLMGTVNPNGPAGNMWFKWGPGAVADCATLPNSTTQQVMSTGVTDIDFYDSISGLVTGTTYTYCAVAKNSVNTAVYGAPIQFTAPTGCIPPASGDFAISSNCQLQNVYDGVDTATSAKDLVNTATLTVNDGKTLTVGPGKSVGYGTLTRVGTSAIVKFSNAGGIIKRGPLWAADSDNDGYPDSTATALFTDSATTITAPSGYVRRSYAATNGIDCSPLNGYVFENLSNMATDADHDGYYIGSPASLCIGKNSSVNGRVYWNDPTNSYNYIYAGTGGPFLGANDCDDTTGAPCLPTITSATGTSQTAVTVNWSQAGGPIASIGYDVYYCDRSINGSCTPNIKANPTTLSSSTRSYSHSSGISCGKTYAYMVRAINDVGQKDSVVATGATNSCCTNMTVYTDTDGDHYGNSTTITNGDVVYSGTSTLSMPAGVQNGTVLIAATYGGGSATTPTGWNLINSSAIYSSETIRLYYRVATGAETTSVVFTGASRGIVAAYNGVDTVSPISGSGVGNISYAGQNTVHGSYFATSSTNTRSILIGANRDGFSATSVPSGYNKVIDRSGMQLFDKNLASSPNYAYDYTVTQNFQGAGSLGVALKKSSVSTTTQCVTGGVASGAWSVNQSDCNDGSASLYQILNGYKDRDGDTRVSSTPYSICSGASLLTGYVSSPAGNDCDDANGSIYQNLTGYRDADQDGYTLSTSSQVCSGASLPSGYSSSVSVNLDCYDNNKCARPGQTSYFSVNRGSSNAQCDQAWNGYEWALTGGGNGQNDSAGNTPNSFDFNCAGGEEKNPGQSPGNGQYYDCPNTVTIHAAPACQYVEIPPDCSCWSYSSCCPCTPSCGVTPNQTYCSSANATIGTCGQQLSDATQTQMIDNATCGGTGNWTWVYGMIGQLQCR